MDETLVRIQHGSPNGGLDKRQVTALSRLYHGFESHTHHQCEIQTTKVAVTVGLDKIQKLCYYNGVNGLDAR